MQIAEYEHFADRCFRDTPPPCAAVCPLAIDVREFIRLMRRDSVRSAYRLLRNQMIFPSIAGKLCTEPCRGACVRGRFPEDQSIDLHRLEQICIDKMAGKKPDRFQVPVKEQSAAVAGGSLTGLSCAYRLASHGYRVTVYEQTDMLGGDIGAMLGREWCHAEFLREFSAVNCEFVFGRRIDSLTELSGDAVFAAASGLFAAEEDQRLFSADISGIRNPVDYIAAGLFAAEAIDIFFRTGKHDTAAKRAERVPDQRYYALHYRTEEWKSANGKGDPEAFRCLQCSCSECYDVCPLMEKHKYYPRKICAETVITLKPNMSKRTGVRMIMGCTECGLCAGACPEHIDMGKCLGSAKADFYKSGAMSEAFHDYWISDMDFCRSDEARLLYRPDEGREADILFFPGCQLSASAPDYTIRAYEAVREAAENAALLLDCCGLPAKWAGMEALYQEIRQELLAEWRRLGRPAVVTGCPSCLQSLSGADSEMKVISLYTFLSEHNGCLRSRNGGGMEVTVLDPCSSSAEPGMGKAVRILLSQAGYLVKNPEETPGCCGFGGHIYNAVPKLHHTFAQRRIDASDGTVVTYCANCRDIFAAEGADARHAIGLLLGPEEENREPPELSLRRENRRTVKRSFTGEKKRTGEDAVEILITEGVVRKMDRELILREQVEQVVREAETEGRKLYDEEDHVFYAHRRFRSVTVWVMYQPEEDKLKVLNVYLHRMDIMEEP